MLFATLLALAAASSAQQAPAGQVRAPAAPGKAQTAPAASTFLLQDAEPEEPELPVRRSLNSLDLIVNDQCLTRMDVMGAAMRGGMPGSPEELNERMGAVLNQQVEQMLKTQAGKDLGFDQNMVQRLVEDELKRKEELAGSVSLLSKALSESSHDSGSFYENTESSILAHLWTRSVEGLFPGPGGRPYVDRYVRPGRLAFEYERNKGQLTLPTTVVVQELPIDAQRIGDLGEAKDLADELHERIVDLGEDFGDVAVSVGVPKDTRGVLQPIEERQLATIPGVGEFLAGAQPGDVSAVLPIRSPDGVLRGFRIVKLLEREQPEPPPFQDKLFQKDLTESIQASLDRGRADAALHELLQAAYVWPPEAFGRRSPEAAPEGAAEVAQGAAASQAAPPKVGSKAGPKPAAGTGAAGPTAPATADRP